MFPYFLEFLEHQKNINFLNWAPKNKKRVEQKHHDVHEFRSCSSRIFHRGNSCSHNFKPVEIGVVTLFFQKGHRVFQSRFGGLRHALALRPDWGHPVERFLSRGGGRNE